MSGGDFRFLVVSDGFIAGPTSAQGVVTRLSQANLIDEPIGTIYVVDGDELVRVAHHSSVAPRDGSDWAVVTVTLSRDDTGEDVGTGTYVLDGAA